jgi:hypothetical protein
MQNKNIKVLILSLACLFSTSTILADQSETDSSDKQSTFNQQFDKAWQLSFAKDYATLIQSIPAPLTVTSEKVKEALKKHGYHNIDPDKVYYHRFDGAESSPRTYNGWQHQNESPLQSYTLTQAVMLNAFNRYRDSFPGDIDLFTGIYTQDATGRYFNEHNEVRLLSSKLWDIAYYELDIQKSYSEALQTFWSKNTTRYTQLMRDAYVFSAYRQYHHGLLNQAQYQLAMSLLSPNQANETNVFRFDVYGYDATDILLIESKHGKGGLIYIPGAPQPFYAFSSERQLKKHLFMTLKDPNNRQDLQKHFSLYLRQDGTSYSGVDSALKGFATQKWSEDYLMMKRHSITGNIFARLTEQMKARLVSDGDTMIKSNQEAQRDYVLSVAYSAMTVLPIVDFIAPEIGLPLNIALGASQFGLGIDKAINGDTQQERLKGTKMTSINAAIIGASTILPALAQYGRTLAEVTTTATEALPNSIVLNHGFPTSELDEFSSIPKIVTHPQTGEELLGVRLTNKDKAVLLRADGFGHYREIDPASGRLIEGTRIVRTVDFDTGTPQWIDNGGLKGGNDIDSEVNSGSISQTSDLPELLLPEDLPQRPGMGGSGYADMTGRVDDALRDFLELEGKVDPYAYLTDVKKLHRVSIAAQEEIKTVPFLESYDQELTGSLVYRGDTRLPDEIFHSGFNRKVEPVKFVRYDHHSRGIRGVVSTSTDQGVAVDYALHNQRGYVYAVQLNHGGKSVDTLLRGETLHEIATLNVPPEDIMFAVGPFTGTETYYRDLIDEQELRTAELLINPHSTASAEVAEKAFEKMKATLRYPLSPEMSFSERYANRTDLFWHEDEVELAEPVVMH